MKSLLHKIIVTFLAFAVGVTATTASILYQHSSFASPFTLYGRGKLEAAFDISTGKSLIRTYGEPIIGYDPYKEILARDYGVKLIVVAGCSVTEELTENVRGYNEVQQAAIEKRYGKGILNKIHQQSQQVYKEYVEKPNIHQPER